MVNERKVKSGPMYKCFRFMPINEMEIEIGRRCISPRHKARSKVVSMMVFFFSYWAALEEKSFWIRSESKRAILKGEGTAGFL